MSRQLIAVFALACVMFAQAGTARAAEPVPTTISIPDLHCMNCAKRIGAELYKVSGVAAVQADIKTKTLIVTPKAGVALSPKALWEAVELAEEAPAKLTGPGGTFSKKPPA